LAYFQTRLNLQCGDLDKARAWASGAVLPSGWSFEELPPLLQEFQQSILTRVHLLRGDYQEVLAVAERICPPAEQGGRLARVAELRLYQAVALLGLGRSSEALDPFRKSLELAERSGNLRLFLDVEVPVQDLIRSIGSQVSQGDFIAQLVGALSGRKLRVSPPAQEGLVEPLTGREWQVLELMGQGFSNQAIADQLVVSVNTVKKHTSNIYAKLEVRNRAQAVLKAGNLGLLGGKLGDNLGD
jgi:LuxR family maltose regulon positive regulatory protein